MRSFILLFTFYFLIHFSHAQTPAAIISELKEINNNMANEACITGHGDLISNRAFNIFLSNKVGTYLTNEVDLSLYKNNATLNTLEGTLAVSHNLYQAKGNNDRATSFINVGVRANVIDAFSASFSNKSFNNQLGFAIKQTWVAKGNTYFNKCVSPQVNNINQKQIMDAQRAAIIYTLETKINKKNTDFENTLMAIQQTDVPGQNIDSVKNNLRKSFYLNLQTEYIEQFAVLQSETLIENFYFNLITTNWTSISGYIPLLNERYNVAQSFNSNFGERHAYPWELTISHTWFLESTKWGRFFVNISGEVFGNNSQKSNQLNKTNLTDYLYFGGTDTLHLAQFKTADAYIGNYKNFITPALRGQIAYLPPDWHLGLSCMLEQNFGTYNALNGKLGLPIVLIDKKGAPAATFEFQVRFFDMANRIEPNKKLSDKTSVGLSVGIPFSKIVY